MSAARSRTIDGAARLAVAEFLLRLSLKLRLLDLDTDDRCKASRISSPLSAGSFSFRSLFFLRIIVKSLRQRALETSQMGTALRGIDIVDESYRYFPCRNRYAASPPRQIPCPDALAVDNRFIELLIASVQVGDKFLDTALIVEGLLMLHFSVIPQGDLLSFSSGMPVSRRRTFNVS